jgi:hypothetical protein
MNPENPNSIPTIPPTQPTPDILPTGVTTEQQPITPIPTQPPVAPELPKPKSKVIPFLIILLILVIFVVSGYWFYHNFFASRNIAEVVTTPTPVAIIDPTSNWKVFSDTKNGIEFKYPQDWYAKQMAGWTLILFLDNKDFVIPEATEFMTPIQVSITETMNTNTNVKSYPYKTIEEAAKFSKTNLFGENVSETDNLIIAGKKAIQLAGTAGPGMLDGLYFKITYIQLDNKVLTVSLNNIKNYETIYDQILSTFKFITADETTNWKTFSGKYYSFKYPVTGWIFNKIEDTPADQDWVDLYLDTKQADIHASVEQLAPKGFTFDQIIENDKSYMETPKQETINLPIGQTVKISGKMNNKSNSNEVGRSWQVIYFKNKDVVYRLFLLQNSPGEYDKIFNEILNSLQNSSLPPAI